PRIAFVNKMDRVGADFYRVVSQMKTKLSMKPLILQIPIVDHDGFYGLVDIVSQKAVYWEEKTLGTAFREEEIPEEYRKLADGYRSEMLETLAEFDEDIFESYFGEIAIPADEIKSVIRKGTVNLHFFPVLCGAALKNMGVQKLLDAVLDYLPSPADLPPVVGLNPETSKDEGRQPSIDAPFSALLFKAQTDPHLGLIYYMRVYSGKVEGGDKVRVYPPDRVDRVSRLLLMHANKREETKSLTVGEIGVVTGIRECKTGYTLCSLKHPIAFESMRFPEPVIFVSLEPKTRMDDAKLDDTLRYLQIEDPTFKVRTDEETSQRIVSGMGELHLEIIVERLKREFGVECHVSRPQVSYRETICSTVTSEGRFIKQTGGRGHYGVVKLRIEPTERGRGISIVNKLKEGVIPKPFVPAIEQGVREQAEVGVHFGYPVIDIQVTILDGQHHPIDSSDLDFKVAAQIALRGAFEKGEPTLLEPIMSLEIIVPQNYLGDVINDINSRKGRILSVETNKQEKIIEASLALAKSFGYATDLRSITQGHGIHTMQFSHYEPKEEKEETI
ncbi:MAG: elongation factor G, partial [candidate division WOR-3 bacterium]